MRFNECRGAPLSPTDFCSWEAQKGMFAIRLRVRVVKWLGSHLIESRQSSATPGELGGILLGQAHLDAGKQILLIEGFVPVPCNYGENFPIKTSGFSRSSSADGISGQGISSMLSGIIAAVSLRTRVLARRIWPWPENSSQIRPVFFFISSNCPRRPPLGGSCFGITDRWTR